MFFKYSSFEKTMSSIILLSEISMKPCHNYQFGPRTALSFTENIRLE